VIGGFFFPAQPAAGKAIQTSMTPSSNRSIVFPPTIRAVRRTQTAKLKGDVTDRDAYDRHPAAEPRLQPLD
jgi:hypothetical protein